jgi:hypothetical protein
MGKELEPKKTPKILMLVPWLQKLARRANPRENSEGA